VVERSSVPILIPEYDYESQGMEDPRLVKIDDLYYLTYTAYDGINHWQLVKRPIIKNWRN